MNKQPAGQLETIYREMELRFAPLSGMWICGLGTFESAVDAMLAIDKHAEDERRISVPVIVKNYGDPMRAEAVLVDGRQVWVKHKNGRRTKEQMSNVFFADASSMLEYKRQDATIKSMQKEIDALKETRDALHVTVEGLLAAHNAAKAGG